MIDVVLKKLICPNDKSHA